jgi:hypothetical protein
MALLLNAEETKQNCISYYLHFQVGVFKLGK